MIEIILVATDGSDQACKAVDLAGDLALGYGACVNLVHVLPPSAPEGFERPIEAPGDQQGSNPVRPRRSSLAQSGCPVAIARVYPGERSAAARRFNCDWQRAASIPSGAEPREHARSAQRLQRGAVCGECVSPMVSERRLVVV